RARRARRLPDDAPEDACFYSWKSQGGKGRKGGSGLNPGQGVRRGLAGAGATPLAVRRRERARAERGGEKQHREQNRAGRAQGEGASCRRELPRETTGGAGRAFRQAGASPREHGRDARFLGGSPRGG